MIWTEIHLVWQPFGRNFLTPLEVQVGQNGNCSIRIGKGVEEKVILKDLNPQFIAAINELLLAIPFSFDIHEAFIRETNSTVSSFRIMYHDKLLTEFSTDLIGYKSSSVDWNLSGYMEEMDFNEKEVQTTVAWSNFVKSLGSILDFNTIT